MLPNETPDVMQPIHCVSLVHTGILIGEIFDLDPLAADCAAAAGHGAVGSPINP